MARAEAEVRHVLELCDGRVAKKCIAGDAEERVAPESPEGLDLQSLVGAAGAETLRLVAGRKLDAAGQSDAGGLVGHVERVGRSHRRIAYAGNGLRARLRSGAAAEKRQADRVAERGNGPDRPDARYHIARPGDA